MPWPDRVSASLRRLYRASRRVPEPELKDMSVPPQALEHDLIARLPPPRRRPPRDLGSYLRGHRLTLSSSLAAIAVAAACQVPFDYDRSFGVSLWCEAASAGPFASDAVRGLADRLQQRTDAEQVTIRVHSEDGGRSTLQIDLWGKGPTRASEALLAEAAALTAARCRVEPHVETVHGTLGGRLGLELFDLELLDRDDAETARAQLLERLEARGLRGSAEVEISDRGDGQREVKIRIEAEQRDAPE